MTWQLLMSSGFNPIAATTPEMMMSFQQTNSSYGVREAAPALLLVYADPSGCTCAYVGSVAAMDKYRASFGALPADTLSSSGFRNPEQKMINGMENDNAGAQFSNDVLGPDF